MRRSAFKNKRNQLPQTNNGGKIATLKKNYVFRSRSQLPKGVVLERGLLRGGEIRTQQVGEATKRRRGAERGASFTSDNGGQTFSKSGGEGEVSGEPRRARGGGGNRNLKVERETC